MHKVTHGYFIGYRARVTSVPTIREVVGIGGSLEIKAVGVKTPPTIVAADAASLFPDLHFLPLRAKPLLAGLRRHWPHN